MNDDLKRPPQLDWEQRYKEQPVESMPWFYPELDPDLAEALDRLALANGRVLDIGTGPGTQAIALAKRGFDVTATDLSKTAIEKASKRAKSDSVRVRFKRDDILRSAIDETFDVVFDRGCFHVIEPDRRDDYARIVAGLVRPDGLLFLKCFSVKQPGTFGPHRLAPKDIETVFSSRFSVESIRETIYQGPLKPPPIALFSVLRRKSTP